MLRRGRREEREAAAHEAPGGGGDAAGGPSRYRMREQIIAIGDDYWIEDARGTGPSTSTARPCGCATP